MKTPSPSLVVASAALVVALGGTGVALTALPRNSIGTAQLKKDAVTSAKVKDGSLVAADFKSGVLLSGQVGATGATGATGPAGPTGATGPAGPTQAFQTSGAPGTIISAATDVLNFDMAASRAGTMVFNYVGRVGIGGGASNGNSANVTCVTQMIPPTGPQQQVASVVTSASAQFISGVTYQDAPVAITGSFSVPSAGTYRLNVNCTKQNLNGTPTISLLNYDVTAVLAGG